MSDDLFPSATHADVPLSAQIACVEREIRMRERAYPHWVAAGKMKYRESERELLGMRAVLATLREVVELERQG